MKLTDLTPKQLDRLERQAQHELERRARRRPAASVRQVLRAVAAEAGYTLGDVFPEFEKARLASRHAPHATGRQGKLARSHKALEVSAPTATAPALDPAQRLVRTLATHDPKAAGLSQALSTVRALMGLEENWPAFHAAMEQAARRNWLHFRGNDHCVLTPDGLAEATS